MMYWMALSNEEYKSYLDSIATDEKEKMALDKRTIDFVTPGEQQPEVDHAMQDNKSRSGTANDNQYREAFNGGSFSYNLSTNGETNLILIVRYWGAEWGNRKFDIYVDDEKLAAEDNISKWNQSKFFDVGYVIPGDMLKDKNHVRIKFQSLQNSTAGGVYYVRLVRGQ